MSKEDEDRERAEEAEARKKLLAEREADKQKAAELATRAQAEAVYDASKDTRQNDK